MRSTILDGYYHTVTFDNGYTASIVSHGGSYGGDQGLFEIAVKRNGSIVYDTPITSDVLGWLTHADVAYWLEKIADLPAYRKDD